MDEQKQREFLRDAVERGLTIKQAIDELEGNNRSALWQIRNPDFYTRYGYGSGAKWPAAPQSECPVVQQILNHMSSILAFVYESPNQDMFNSWVSQKWGLSCPSTPEEQERRATIVRDWFAKDFLGYIQKEPYSPPSHKLVEASADVILASSQTPGRRAAAIMQAVLTIMSGVSEAVAQANVSPWSAPTMISTGSDLTFSLAYKMMVVAKRDEPLIVHPHPEGDLDRALTLAEAAAGVGSSPEDGNREPDADLMAQLEAAGSELGFTLDGDAVAPFIPADDMTPGGVLKK